MLKEKIKEVADIIREKVLTGDYKFISCATHTASIEVEEDIIVDLWVANEPKYNFAIYETGKLLHIEEHQFKSDEDRLKGWNLLKPHVIAYREKELKKAKAEKIKQLEKELYDMGVL